MDLLTGFELIFGFFCACFLSFGIVGLVAVMQEIIMKIID
jgi:hypothetical protein